jgi:predicted hotdog family 3-hydroxylacyl-ACP dehydratase
LSDAFICEVIMRKRRGSNLATDSMIAATSTAMTLWHRLPMFGLASVATVAERQKEATRMVDEKAAAFVEGCIAANMEIARMVSAAAMGQFASLANAPLTIASAGLKPAFRTVNANAKRLNRRTARG